jgi:hypothetical protein
VVELLNIVSNSLIAYMRSSSTKITGDCLQQQQQVLYADTWFMWIDNVIEGTKVGESGGISYRFSRNLPNGDGRAEGDACIIC